MRTFKPLLLFFGFILIFSCEDNIQKTEPKTLQILPIHEIQNDTLYKSEDTVIVHFTYDRTDTLLQFKIHISDTNYFIQPQGIEFNGKLDFTKYEYKKLYITTTKLSVKEEGVNFAGHFCFAYWGCGSNCQLSAVIDMRTGKVYNGLEASNGYKFKTDSKIVVVNPPDSFGWYNKNIFYEIPEEYVWEGLLKNLKAIASGKLAPFCGLTLK